MQSRDAAGTARRLSRPRAALADTMPAAWARPRHALLCALIGSAAALESRGPKARNYFDTVGAVNFQGSHACKTTPTIMAPKNEEEVCRPHSGRHSCINGPFE